MQSIASLCVCGSVQSIAWTGPQPIATATYLTGDNFHLSPPIPFPDVVGKYVAAARADNTYRAYAADLRAFLAAGGRVPCTDRELAAFVADHAGCWAPSTMARRVVGIGHAHRAAAHPDPTRSALVRDVLRGLHRLHGRPVRQVRPWLLEDLDRLGEAGSVRELRDRALLGLGFATALRRSELVNIDVADVAFDPGGLRVRVRAGKGDAVRYERTVAVADRAAGLCPVAAVRQWLHATGLDGGPLFRPVDRWGNVRPMRLSPGAVATILKCHARRLRLDPATIAGHSLRAGFVTSAIRAQLPLDLICRQTGHRSLAVLQRYIRRSDAYAGTQRLWSDS